MKDNNCAEQTQSRSWFRPIRFDNLCFCHHKRNYWNNSEM